MGRKKRKPRLGQQKTEEKTRRKEAKRGARDRKKYDQDLDEALRQIRADDLARAHEQRREAAPRPSARARCSLVAHPSKDSVFIMFGGEANTPARSDFFRDLYRCRVVAPQQDAGSCALEWSWTRTDNSPLPRSSHQAVAVRYGGRDLMFVFGGEFSTPNGERFRHFGDFWCLDIEALTWEEVALAAPAAAATAPAAAASVPRPSPRSGHRMLAWRKKLVMFGGYFDQHDVTRYFGDLWLFDLDERAWTLQDFPSTAPKPGPRSACQIALDGDLLYVFGGYAREKRQKTSEIDAAAAAAAAAASRKKGGKHGAEEEEEPDDEVGVCFDDIWRIDLGKLVSQGASSVSWEQVRGAGRSPSPRSGTCSAVYKRRIYFFGGVSDSVDGGEPVHYQEVNSYNFEKERWFLNKLKDPAKAPLPRYGCSATLCGSHMIVWGGVAEIGNSEVTFDDLHRLDLNKLDGFQTLLQPTTITAQPEAESSEDEEEGADEEESSSSSSSDESDDEEEEGSAGTCTTQPTVFAQL